MNANPLSKKGAVLKQASEQPISHLRVLSKLQREQVSVVTKDWQRFTRDIYTEMFDKI